MKKFLLEYLLPILLSVVTSELCIAIYKLSQMPQ